jgi:hypothetical protein
VRPTRVDRDAVDVGCGDLEPVGLGLWRRGFPASGLPPVAEHAQVAGRKRARDRSRCLLDVTPTLVYVHLALFGMADAALGELPD